MWFRHSFLHDEHDLFFEDLETIVNLKKFSVESSDSLTVPTIAFFLHMEFGYCRRNAKCNNTCCSFLDLNWIFYFAIRMNNVHSEHAGIHLYTCIVMMMMIKLYRLAIFICI